MPRSILLVLTLVLAAAGAVGLLLLVGGDEAERGAPVAPPDPAPAPDAGPEPDDAAGLARPGRDALPETAGPVPVEAAARAEVALTEAAAERRSVELEVVAAATGAALEGAEVSFVTTAGGEDEGGFHDLDGVDGFMVERGRRVRTGAGGRVRVPLGAGRTLVTARHAGLFGSVAIDGDGDDDVVRLELVPDVALRVQVVDGLGRAQAHVPVELRRTYSGYYTHGVRRRTTAEDGTAAFPHVATNLQRATDSTWSVAVDALLLEDVARPLDLEDLPRDVVRLVLPVTGAVEVRAFEPDGEPLAVGGQVSLGIVRAGESRTISPFSGKRRATVEGALEDGRVTFRRVELGQELEAQVRRKGSDVPTRAYGPGPARPGDVATLDVYVGADHPIVLLRAVEPGGAPLADTDLEVRVELSAMHLGQADLSPVRTDAEGRFRVDLGQGFEEGAKRVMTVVRGTREKPEGFAALDLSRALPDGINDLGDVVVGEVPVFVAGRVVDGSGAGVPGAQLHLRRKQDEETRNWWEEVWDFRHETDDDGRFEVRSSFTGVAFQLGARGEDLVSAPVGFLPGERNLVIAIRAGGGLAGSVLVDEGVPLGELDVTLDPELAGDGDGGLRWSDRNADVQAPGAFRFRNLLPGAYTVNLRLDGDDQPLLRVEGVRVVGGEVTRDPRLQEVDLRGRLFAYRFTIVSPDPDERVQGNLRLGAAGSGDKPGHLYFHESELDVVSRHAALDIDVNARGFRLLELLDVRGDRVIELKRGIRVRVVLTGDAEVPEPPRYVKAVLVPAESDHLGIDWGAPTFDESREIVIEAPTSGRMKVQWLIEKRASSGSAIATSVEVEPEQFVEIADTDAEQTVEVHLTQEQLEKILAKL